MHAPTKIREIIRLLKVAVMVSCWLQDVDTHHSWSDHPTLLRLTSNTVVIHTDTSIPRHSM